ncbi:MAG: hypothetical protein V4517_04190 [Pseudomonadota bacterium]
MSDEKKKSRPEPENNAGSEPQNATPHSLRRGASIASEDSRHGSEAFTSSHLPIVAMRSSAFHILYLTAISVAMFGWLWMLFEGIAWALT